MTKHTTLTAAIALAAFALPFSAASAQTYTPVSDGEQIEVYGQLPADLDTLEEGPSVDGFISARDGDRMQVTTGEGADTVVRIAPATDIKARGGFLGLGRTELTAASLLNGLPVEVKTRRWGQSLVASEVRFSDGDHETAAMVARGTAQGFAEQTAATDALRNRVANIDDYNIVDTTNVYFDTGEWSLNPAAQAELCQAAQQAQATDNALLLVVGYTDATGPQEYNQVLSERRASRVVNYLQQQCGWQPYRMLTPTGMAEADPAADNSSAYGMAQNRRVAVNIMVSKAVEGL
ncbi:MAG: OmpA family protein [Alteraurantiacibacter sp.]